MIEYILFILGIIFLIKGADYLVDGSSSLGKRLGVSSLVIGLTIVTFGTTMPEFVVNVIAALEGASQIAFGNIIGSNICNILLVLGIAAIIYPISIESNTIWKQIPFALLAVIVLFIISNKYIINGIDILNLNRADGLILMTFFALFIYYVIELALKSRAKLKKRDLKIERRSYTHILLLIIVGIISLYLGGRWTVNGAVYMASRLGLSQYLISATIVAIGTSLPELMTAIVAALKNKVDIAVGNVIGSNIFNIFWILGITSLISPISIPNFINTDIIILFFVTLLLFLAMFVGRRHVLERWNGIMFVMFYIAYIAFLIWRG
jgi:cation:H+ antiporter